MNAEVDLEHVSVLKSDVQKYLDLVGGETVIDATLGLGGHAKDILERIGSAGRLIAFDQDERNLQEAKKRLEDFTQQTTYFHDNFRYLKTRVDGEVDAILFDLGLSSPHIDQAGRGFSFNQEGPLDMRFDPRNKLTAYKVVNEYDEGDLVRIFFQYGEEKMAKKIAHKICVQRQEQPFETTTELAAFIEALIPKKRSKKTSKSHPATKIFQAIRIEVNDELNVLRDALEQAMELLKIDGRLVVISYHSLEDRIVKQFMKALQRPEPTPEQSIYQSYGDPIVEILTKKPVAPNDQELEENPRSRSAKLRACKKIRPYP